MKRRYHSSAAIEKAIDRCYANAQRLSLEADEREDHARQLIKDADLEPGLIDAERSWMREQAKAELRLADRRRKRAGLYLNQFAPALGRKLAAFQTELFDFAGTDRSIPV